KKQKATPRAANEADHQSEHSNPDVKPSVSPYPQGEPSQYHCEITCTKEKDWWDKAKPFVEVLGLIALVIYTIYTAKMYRANRDAADAAKESADTGIKQLELAERPWVDANITLDGPFTFNVNGANITVKIELRNNGHSPAFNTWATMRGLVAPASINPDQYRDEVCKTVTDQRNKVGISLFPGVTFQQQFQAGIP